MADLNAYFKSIIDQDREAVVICDLDHTILYMNPAAVVDYGKYGGAALLGKSLLACHNPHSCLLYTSPSPRDRQKSRMPSSA